MEDVWDGVPDDALQEILLRVPPYPRRRLRLVCRYWRGVIDERLSEPRARTKVLAFFGERRGGSRAIVFDVPPGGKNCDGGGGGSRELDLEGSGADAAGVRMIGTRNGLICVQRETGGIAVLNAAVRAMLDVLPPRNSPSSAYASTYTFAYLPATGRYKIAHLACDPRSGELAAVHVFTLGDDVAWREVPAPAGSGCRLRFGLVSADDAVAYWVTRDAQRIMAFDLGDESFAVLDWPPLPVLLWMMDDGDHTCRLAEVRGRLGLVVRRPHHEPNRAKTEVWVLEGEREEERAWVKSLTVLAQGGTRLQEVALPHVAHGKHVLTTCCQRWGGWPSVTLSAHRVRGDSKLGCGAARVGAPSSETRLGAYDTSSLRTFAYVETIEPPLLHGDNSPTTV